MSRSKTLWEAECEQICRDYQDGKMELGAARHLLMQHGWDAEDAENELAEWATGDECYCDFASREFFGCFDRTHVAPCPQAKGARNA